MMKKLFVLPLFLVSLVGCGDNPSAPSTATKPTPVATGPSSPSSTPTGQPTVPNGASSWYSVTGPVVEGTKLVWRVTITNAARPFHLVTSSNQNDDHSGGGFTGRNGPNFRVAGQDTYKVGQSGIVTLAFDVADFNCGRVQEDASLILDDNGESVNIIGYLYRYTSDCTAPPPVVPPPPPPPVTSCREFVGANSVLNGTATITILPGGNVDISVVSYAVVALTQFLPQPFYRVNTQRLTEGTHTITVETTGLFQTDIYCGVYPAGTDLTEDNYAYWSSLELASDSSWHF